MAFYASDADQSMLMPILIRELPPHLGAPPSWRDATSPYGYSGPVTTKGISIDALRCSLQSLQRVAREHDIVSAFIRLNPFRSVPTDVLREFGTLVNHGPVVFVDLTKSPEEWRAETQSGHRQDIARLIRSGYSVVMDDWSTYPAFRALYSATMRYRSASAFYLFSDQYFADLREELDDRVHLCTVRGPSGDIAASALFFLVDGIADYHLSGTAEAHRSKSPSKLLLDFARGWAKQSGAVLMNLGGGFGGSADSLHKFKAGFSRSMADFYTVRIVFDTDRYEYLNKASRAQHSVGDEPDAFFPTYRQPQSGTQAS